MHSTRSCSRGRYLNGQYKRVAGDNSSGSFPVPDEPQRIPGRVVGDHLIGMDMPSAISFLLTSIFDRVLSSYAPTVSPFRPSFAIVVFFPAFSIPRTYVLPLFISSRSSYRLYTTRILLHTSPDILRSDVVSETMFVPGTQSQFPRFQLGTCPHASCKGQGDPFVYVRPWHRSGHRVPFECQGAVLGWFR